MICIESTDYEGADVAREYEVVEHACVETSPVSVLGIEVKVATSAFPQQFLDEAELGRSPRWEDPGSQLS